MKSKTYKTGAVTLHVNYGYDVHSITFSRRTFVKIGRGVVITVKGQGFHWDAVRDQDFWLFNDRVIGSLYVYTQTGGEVYIGSMDDGNVWVDIDHSS